MKKISKIISIILSVVMIFSIVSISTYANESMAVSNEKGIARITATPITIIENYDGYEIIDDNGDTFFYYYTNFMCNDVDYIIEYKDGSTENLRYWEVENEMGLSFEFSIDQYSSPLKLGVNEIPFSFGDFEGVVELSIVENPVVSIDIEDISIIEGTSGNYNDVYDEYRNVISKYYNYTYSDTKFILTLTDGSIVESSEYGTVQLYGVTYSLNITDDQSDTNPWGVGEHAVKGSIVGVEDDFTVTITESPIESVVLEDFVLFEGIDNYYGQYSVNSKLSEVIFKDGTKAEILNDSAIIYNGEYYCVNDNSWEMQYEQPWTVGGTYKVTATLLGCTTTFNVTIAENPIKELQLIKMPDKTEYIQGDSINLKGAVIRINYTDNTFEDIEIDYDYTSGHIRYFYSEKIDRLSYIELYDAYELGQQNALLILLGKTCNIPVVVQKNLMKSISIREDADKSLIVTVNNLDNTSYEMTLLDISFCWPNDDGTLHVDFFTDKGTFGATVFSDEGSFAIGIENAFFEGTIKSNVLSSSEWFETVKAAYDYSWGMACHYDMNLLKTEHYRGEITADNIDDIVSFAAYHMIGDENGDWWLSPDGEDYLVYSGKEVKEATNGVLGIENVDLALSQNYDSENDMYKTTKFPRKGSAPSKCCPSKISYSDGVWYIESIHYFEKETVVYLRLNDKQQILEYDINEKHICEKDANEGVVIEPENEDVLPEGTEINVTIVETTEDSITFDITLENNGTEVQPNGNVTVKIPVPADMDTNGLSVYRAEEDGTYTNMNAVYEDGYMVFTTDHFSIYVMTVEELTAPSEPECSHADNDDDGYCDDCGELLDPTVECECNCHKTGIAKFFFNFILFFQRLFGANKECACGVAHY